MQLLAIADAKELKLKANHNKSITGIG